MNDLNNLPGSVLFLGLGENNTKSLCLLFAFLRKEILYSGPEIRLLLQCRGEEVELSDELEWLSEEALEESLCLLMEWRLEN